MQKKTNTMNNLAEKYSTFFDARNMPTASMWFFFLSLIALYAFLKPEHTGSGFFVSVLLFVGCLIAINFPFKKYVPECAYIEIGDILEVAGELYAPEYIEQFEIFYFNGNKLKYSEFLFMHSNVLMLTFKNIKTKSLFGDFGLNKEVCLK